MKEIFKAYTPETVSICVGMVSILVLILYLFVLFIKVSRHKIIYNNDFKAHIYIGAAVIAMELLIIASDTFNNVNLWFAYLNKYPVEHLKYWLVLVLNILIIKHLKAQHT